MKTNKTIIPALFTMMLWGSLFPMAKLGFAAYSIDTTADILLFAGVRFVICGGVMTLITAIRDRDSYRGIGSSIPSVLLVGVFAIILYYALTYAGLETTDSSKSALIVQVGSLIYVCISFLFIKEDRPTLRKVAGAVIGFLGIIALNISADGFSLAIGDLLILGASFSVTISNVISKKVFSRVAPLTMMAISQLFGGIVLLIVGIAMGGTLQLDLSPSLFILLYICAASVISHCIWYSTVKRGELSKLVIIKFAEPVFACIFGAVLLGENIWRVQYLVAFLLISGGVWLSNTQKRASKSKAAECE